ncbi:gamma-tubulin complex component [Elysia marginata]|uniref:Gamma-tubulin complex component n=1 Tax=Elysia marginata TaxID=1093978 RepID=A0AAV4EX95_9GAST|nr:gamma-tubulin complex component [Elysia marginata]
MSRILKSTCERYGLNININTLHVDFETSVTNAVKELFPATQIKGCCFHLGQAWWRKIQELGHKDSGSDIGNWLRLIFGLPSIPAEEMDDCFVFTLMANAPDDERISQFSDYLLRSFITMDSCFPPIMWTFSPEDSKRTTNGCESFHRHFGDQFISPHPNIFDWLEKIKEEQTKIALKIKAAMKPRKQATNEEAESRKRQKIYVYKSGELTQYDFFKNSGTCDLYIILSTILVSNF